LEQSKLKVYHSSSWKCWKKRTGEDFPYKGINDPEYIKARNKLFNESGHGWWWSAGYNTIPNRH